MSGPKQGLRLSDVRAVTFACLPSVIVFTTEHGKITGIDIVTDPAHLAELDVRID